MKRGRALERHRERGIRKRDIDFNIKEVTIEERDNIYVIFLHHLPREREQNSIETTNLVYTITVLGFYTYNGSCCSSSISISIRAQVVV